MNWKIKLICEKIVGMLPSNISIKVHRSIQRKFSRINEFNVIKQESEVNRAVNIFNFISKKRSFEFDGINVLELGTGWHGTDLVLLKILGANKIVTCDVFRHLEIKFIKWAISGFSKNKSLISKTFGVHQELIEERIDYMNEATTLDDFLKQNNISYLAPKDILNINLENNYFDLFYSYSVLQRIEKSKIGFILNKIKYTLKCDAYMLHVIHHGDHNARHDKNLNPLMYLKYGKNYELLQTKKINYQNRLRNSDFCKIFKNCEINILNQEIQSYDKDLLNEIILNKAFNDYNDKDIIISRTQLICNY